MIGRPVSWIVILTMAIGALLLWGHRNKRTFEKKRAHLALSQPQQEIEQAQSGKAVVEAAKTIRALDSSELENIFSHGSLAEVLRASSQIPDLSEQDKQYFAKLLCRFYADDSEQFEMIRWRLLSAKKGPIDLSVCEG